MFKKTLVFSVEEKEVINFCRLLGSYGLRFKIGKLRSSTARIGDENQSVTYRVFTVYASKRKAYALYEELNMNREATF